MYNVRFVGSINQIESVKVSSVNSVLAMPSLQKTCCWKITMGVSQLLFNVGIPVIAMS